jgi:hypothetical protein
MNHITQESKVEWLVIANIERTRIAQASLRFAAIDPTDICLKLKRSQLFSESVQSYRLASHVLHEVKNG